MFPILLIAISAWAVAQGLKLLITTAVYRKFDISYLTSGGGMPSFDRSGGGMPGGMGGRP